MLCASRDRDESGLTIRKATRAAQLLGVKTQISLNRVADFCRLQRVRRADACLAIGAERLHDPIHIAEEAGNMGSI